MKSQCTKCGHSHEAFEPGCSCEELDVVSVDDLVPSGGVLSHTLTEYIKQDIKTMNIEQLRMAYKAVRKIVSGL